MLQNEAIRELLNKLEDFLDHISDDNNNDSFEVAEESKEEFEDIVLEKNKKSFVDMISEEECHSLY